MLLNSHASQVTALAISKDGSLLACADSDLAVHVWNFTDRKKLQVLKGPQAEIRCLAFSLDGKRLAADGDRIIHLWDPRTGQALAGSGQRTAADTSLALSPDGTRLASNGGGLAPMIWNIAAKKTMAPLPEKDVLHGLAFSPDGRWIAGAAETHVRLWDAAGGKPGKALEGSSEHPFTCVAFSPDSTILAAGSSSGQDVWLYRLADANIPDALDGCTIQSLAFHPAGRLLAVGGIDRLATGGSDGAVFLWNIVDREEDPNPPLGGGTTCLAFHPSGQHLAAASLEHAICIWDVPSKEMVAELTGPDNTLNALAYSPDGSLLACQASKEPSGL